VGLSLEIPLFQTSRRVEKKLGFTFHVASTKTHKDSTAPQFEEAQKKPTRVIPCGIHEGSESLHLHNILKANFKSCKCGLEFNDATLPDFEEG